MKFFSHRPKVVIAVLSILVVFTFFVALVANQRQQEIRSKAYDPDERQAQKDAAKETDSKSGSPDERQEKNDAAAKEKNQSGSPDERQEKNDAAKKAAEDAKKKDKDRGLGGKEGGGSAPTSTPNSSASQPNNPAPTVAAGNPLPTVPANCPRKAQGDANCDGKINGLDFSIWLNSQCNGGVGQTCSDRRADFNGDGKVNDDDYNIWLANRGT